MIYISFDITHTMTRSFFRIVMTFMLAILILIGCISIPIVTSAALGPVYSVNDLALLPQFGDFKYIDADKDPSVGQTDKFSSSAKGLHERPEDRQDDNRDSRFVLQRRDRRGKRTTKMPRYKISYLLSNNVNMTGAQILRALDREFNALFDKTDLSLSWFAKIFTRDSAIEYSKNLHVCINNYYDLEDEYNTTLISGRSPGRPSRKFAKYQNDVRLMLLEMTIKEKVEYFLRKALWCDNKFAPNHPLRSLNEHVIEHLAKQYDFLLIAFKQGLIRYLKRKLKAMTIQKPANSALLAATKHFKYNKGLF